MSDRASVLKMPDPVSVLNMPNRVSILKRRDRISVLKLPDRVSVLKGSHLTGREKIKTHTTEPQTQRRPGSPHSKKLCAPRDPLIHKIRLSIHPKVLSVVPFWARPNSLWKNSTALKSFTRVENSRNEMGFSPEGRFNR
jgi:hypothetical protein